MAPGTQEVLMSNCGGNAGREDRAVLTELRAEGLRLGVRGQSGDGAQSADL